MEITTLASGSKGNCYRVSDGSTSLLIECGIPIKRIKEGLSYRLSAIDGCLVSHEHKDHCKAVKDIMHQGISVYSSEGTFMALGMGRRPYGARVLSSGTQTQILTMIVMPFRTAHDAVEPIGFVIYSLWTGEKLLYATDTYYVRYKVPGLTHIMVECNYCRDMLDANVEAGVVPMSHRDRLLRSHFELENVKQFLRSNDLSKLREVHLLHLSDGNSDAERFKREVMELTGKPTYIA